MCIRDSAFNMEIHYSNRSRLSEELEDGATFHKNPEDMLQRVQLLSLHCPSTPQTRHFLNAKRIALLPDGAVVVNTARGDVVEDDALIEAVKSGKVSGVGLDVYEG